MIGIVKIYYFHKSIPFLQHILNNASKTQPMVKKMDNYWSPAEAMGKSIIQGDVTLENADQQTKDMGASMNK